MFCRHWERYGWCRFNEKCHYDHPQLSQISEKEKDDNGAEDITEPGQTEMRMQNANGKPRNKPICRSWARHGSCYRDAECRYDHPSEKYEERRNDKTEQQISKSKVMCKYVEKGLKCPFGDQWCRFTHDTAKSKAELNPPSSSQVRTARKDDEPKNESKGIQQKDQIHSLCSLKNQVKQQSMEMEQQSREINELKRMVQSMNINRM